MNKIRRICTQTMFDNKKRFLYLLFTSPAVWFTVVNLDKLLSEWSKFTFYFKSKAFNIFALHNIRYSVELIWQTPKGGRSILLSRFFYNKATFLLGEFFNALGPLRPNSYFVEGDSGGMIPVGIDPIPIVLVPLWFLGLFYLIKEKKYQYFLFLFATSIVIYLTGQTSFYYLIIIVPFIIYAINIAFHKLSKKTAIIYIIVHLFYTLFLVARIHYFT